MQQKQPVSSSALNAPASSADKGKRKVCDISDGVQFVSETPCSTVSGIDDADFLCNLHLLLCFACYFRIYFTRVTPFTVDVCCRS